MQVRANQLSDRGQVLRTQVGARGAYRQGDVRPVVDCAGRSLLVAQLLDP